MEFDQIKKFHLYSLKRYNEKWTTGSFFVEIKTEEKLTGSLFIYQGKVNIGEVKRLTVTKDQWSSGTTIFRELSTVDDYEGCFDMIFGERD